MINILNDANFEQEVVEASKTKLVLVDFFAPWCGICKIISPIVDTIADEMKDQIIVGKIDVEASPLVAEKYDVMSLPTLALFKDGKLEKSISGPQSKESILELLK